MLKLRSAICFSSPEDLRSKLLDGQRLVLFRLKDQIQEVNVHVFGQMATSALAKKRSEGEEARTRAAVQQALAAQVAAAAPPEAPAPTPAPAPKRRAFRRLPGLAGAPS